MSEPRPRRSPVRVAVLTFGAIVLVGTIASLALLGVNGMIGDDPSARGQAVGRALGIAGVVGAAVAYVIQRRRVDTPR